MSTSATHTYSNMREHQSKIAMMVAYVSWSMLFATLMLGYAVYRFSSTSWPPSGFERISLFWPMMSTIILALSSFTFYLASRSYLKREKKNFSFYIVLTFLLGIGFMASQYMLWQKLNLAGQYVSAGIFPSILHGFTWIHAAHVVCALLGVIYLLFQMRVESFKKNKKLLVKNIENFWHFLGVVWLIMFVALFAI